MKVPGADLILLADRAIYWPALSALLIADVHFGKAAAFRAHSIAVPGGTTANDLRRIDALLCETQATSIYILGDMWHAKEGLAQTTIDLIRTWRQGREGVAITLIRGNHDRKCGQLPSGLGIEEVDEPYSLAQLCLSHDPRVCGDNYTLAGHIHPCVRLDGLARQSHRLPCFWFGERCAVLPAFGSFTGCARIATGQNDRVYVPVEGQILAV